MTQTAERQAGTIMDSVMVFWNLYRENAVRQNSDKWGFSEDYLWTKFQKHLKNIRESG